MADNDTFKKKKLNKKDYSGKEKVAKTVKGSVGAAAIITFGPKLIKVAINLGKKIFRL